MRRLFIFLLAAVLPIKAWAGIALPLAAKSGAGGTPGIVLHAGMSAAHVGHDGATDDDCCHSDAAPAAAHECPHLVMPLVAATAQQLSYAAVRLPPPPLLASRLDSIVLDVLLPPPLPLR